VYYPALHKFLGHHTKIAKAPKYDEFFDVAELMDTLEPKIRRFCVDVDSKPAFMNNYDPSVFASLRAYALVLVRINLIARPIDCCRIKATEFVNPNKTHPNGILWVLTRRKGKAYYSWEPILGSHSIYTCPVYVFRRYIEYAAKSTKWSKRPKLDESGEFACVVYGAHPNHRTNPLVLKDSPSV
jgi:hypothetical protein